MSVQRKLILLVGMQLAIATLISRTIECSPTVEPVGLKTILDDKAIDLNEFRAKNSGTADAQHLEEPTDLDGDVEKKAEGLLKKIGSSIKNAIAPAQSYVLMVNRYHKWFQSYKAFQHISKKQIPDPYEILKVEYTKVEKLLIDEELAQQQKEILEKQRSMKDDTKIDEENLEQSESSFSDATAKDLKNRIENIDFVFRTLKLVIDRLEAILKRMEESEGVEIDLEGDLSRGEAVDQEQVKSTMERVKKSVMKSAKNLLTGELVIIARTAAFSGLAQLMEAKPDTGDALDHLRPIIFMIGSATTPVAVSYLMSIEFRAALAVANTLNPLAHYVDMIKNRKKSSTDGS